MSTEVPDSQEPRTGIESSWLEPLAVAFRRWGYLSARLDDLGRIEPMEHPDISDLVRGAEARRVEKLRASYGGPIGAEFMHISDRLRAQWVAQAMESAAPTVDRELILRRLMEAELFERFLHKRYIGTKRYSLEGSAGLIPLLDSLLDTATDDGGRIALIGMSHRGRLNVMANVVGIPIDDLFADLEDVDPKSVLGSGDVKYHLGATGVRHNPSGQAMDVHLVSNPSHLEAVDPVLMGRTRARQCRLGPDGLRQVIPICIHGDAAFAGQGIASETLNMADLPGYRVGGTLHILVNNLLGFTAKPAELHSARFSSDVAKRLEIPIWHVNGEDPAAILRVGCMALEYRNRFQSDVVIDLIGYRRYGHSEIEDPTTTSPVLYKVIEERPVLWELYAKRLGHDTESLKDVVDEFNQRLDEAQEAGRGHSKRPVLSTMPAYWDPYVGGFDNAPPEVETAVPRERLLRVTEAITRVPEDFAIHPKLSKLLERRREMGRGERPLDFGMSEALAFGSLLQEGYLVRLSGEDSRRGTFNHRNAVLFDTTTGQEYIPLHHLDAEQGHFDIVDSPLSEAAVLGYEYGFSRDTPDGLVCWEAQFGDFANGAQIIFDQFIAAAEDKWGLLSGLVIMLPHGFEGQGPEHSSARIERFLQLAAEDNLQICQPSNAAQLFHLLRRQVLQRWRKPLVIFTPKGLLRAKQASSELSELTSGGFCKVLTEPEIEDAQRIILCSGKIAHELRAERERRNDTRTTVICLAQLYPFPEDELYAELQRHQNARKVVWVQEEPANMGALSYVKPELARLVGNRHVTSVKRSASASPATGSSKAHRMEQEALIQLAFA